MFGIRKLARVGYVLATMGACFFSHSCNEREIASTEANGSSGEHRADHDENGMNMALPGHEIAPLERRAIAGDNDAAGRLANHYSQIGRRTDEIRWRTLGADRGDCRSMDLLRELAARADDQGAIRQWNAQMRQHACTRGKAYPNTPREVADQPLWDEE